jgi:hypothetical protein
MGNRSILCRRFALAASAGVLLAVTGCQSGDTLGALSLPGVGGGEGAQPPAREGQITAQELTAYCPAVTIDEANTIHRTYQRGGQDDPSKLTLQASISEATRSCTYGGGMLGMTVAVAGRVVPGPVAGPGSVTLPIRVRVVQGSEVIHDQTFNQEVVLTDTIGATQWVFTDSSYSMPQPAQSNFRVYVGFAEQARR